MKTASVISVLIGSYLLGSIPFGYLLVRYVFTEGEDIRTVGSGGIGATNVTRRAGGRAGALTYALDFTKGALSVLMTKALIGDDYLWLGGAVIAAVVGHVFPIFLGFRGGKGVATGAGALMVIGPIPVIAAMAVWIIVVVMTRYASLASIAASLTLPAWAIIYYGWLRGDPDALNICVIGAAGSLIILATHYENIRRLLAGTESKIGTRIRS